MHAPTHEQALRLGAFVAVFALLASGELVAPRRRFTLARSARWPHTLDLGDLDTLRLRFTVPIAATGLALHATTQGWRALQQVAPPFAAPPGSDPPRLDASPGSGRK